MLMFTLYLARGQSTNSVSSFEADAIAKLKLTHSDELLAAKEENLALKIANDELKLQLASSEEARITAHAQLQAAEEAASKHSTENAQIKLLVRDTLSQFESSKDVHEAALKQLNAKYNELDTYRELIRQLEIRAALIEKEKQQMETKLKEEISSLYDQIQRQKDEARLHADESHAIVVSSDEPVEKLLAEIADLKGQVQVLNGQLAVREAESSSLAISLLYMNDKLSANADDLLNRSGSLRSSVQLDEPQKRGSGDQSFQMQLIRRASEKALSLPSLDTLPRESSEEAANELARSKEEIDALRVEIATLRERLRIQDEEKGQLKLQCDDLLQAQKISEKLQQEMKHVTMESASVSAPTDFAFNFAVKLHVVPPNVVSSF